jgi:hydrolase, NUDIX family
MEYLDLYTRDRVRTGNTILRGTKVPEGFYRLVVHVCIFNSKGQMIIQQRQTCKDDWGGMWDLSAGGSAKAGDSSQNAAKREVLEEIGYDIEEDIRPALTINFKNGFNDVYIIKSDLDISSLKLQEEEVKAVKWATLSEIKSMIADGTFIPYHISFIEMLFFLLEKDGVKIKKEK